MKISNMELIQCSYTIPVRIYAPDTQPTQVIIGIHSFAGSMESPIFVPLAQELTDQGKALVCFDFPAHGISRASAELLRVDHCIQDLLAIAEFVRLSYPESSYGIFATSFGAYIAVLCQDILQDFSMVLRAPAFHMAELFQRSVLSCPLEDFLRQGGAWVSFEYRFYVTAKFYEDLLARPDPIPNRPMAIIQGTEDPMIPASGTEEVIKQAPFTALRLIAGANHRFTGHEQELLDGILSWFDGPGK